MIPLKFKEMFYVDYSLAYAIIKQYGLTDKDKEKIEKINMDHRIRKAIYEILNPLLCLYFHSCFLSIFAFLIFSTSELILPKTIAAWNIIYSEIPSIIIDIINKMNETK